MSPIEAIIQGIHDDLATKAADPTRRTSPFYRYGEKHFDTNEGKPPQVRWKKEDGEFGKKQQGGGKGNSNALASSGSIATFQQDMRCRVWASNESQVLLEFYGLCQAIERVKGPTENPQGITQPSLFDGARVTWLENDGDQGVHGSSLEFNYTVFLNVPETPVTLTTILTASVGFTGSFGTGSTIHPMSGTMEPVFDLMIVTE